MEWYVSRYFSFCYSCNFNEIQHSYKSISINFHSLLETCRVSNVVENFLICKELSFIIITPTCQCYRKRENEKKKYSGFQNKCHICIFTYYIHYAYIHREMCYVKAQKGLNRAVIDDIQWNRSKSFKVTR